MTKSSKMKEAGEKEKKALAQKLSTRMKNAEKKRAAHLDYIKTVAAGMSSHCIVLLLKWSCRTIHFLITLSY